MCNERNGGRKIFKFFPIPEKTPIIWQKTAKKGEGKEFKKVFFGSAGQPSKIILRASAQDRSGGFKG